jgi:hypothetical protein
MTPREFSRIYAILKDIGIDTLRSWIPALKRPEPDVRWFSFSYGEAKGDLLWNSGMIQNDPRLAQLRALEYVLDDIMFNNSTYLSLPPPEPIPL